jgi:putative transposon-encoded protein
MEQTIILKKPIKPFSNSAHIIIPKKHIGKKARIIIQDEKTGGKNECKNRR